MSSTPVRLHEDGIFVSVAAYCDPLLLFTLRSALTQASRPERIVFGVVEQQFPERMPRWTGALERQVRHVPLHPLHARGPCWARALSMSLYQGERWFLQVDSHTWFEPGWDERLIECARRCEAQQPRFLLTAYPNAFEMRDGQPVAQIAGPGVIAHVVKTNEGFANDHPVLLFEGVPVEASEPIAGIHLAGGFLFAPGQFVQDVPYDPFLYFHGEEQSLALRAWTRGWDLLHPPVVPLYHHYVVANQSERPLHWSPDIDTLRAETSAQRTEASNRRLRALLWEQADLGCYGLGRERSLADYARFSGIDYAARAITAQAYKSRFGYV